MTTNLTKGRRIIGKERQTLGKQLAARYGKGSSIRQLANLTGHSYGFVHRLLLESGASLRGRGGGRPGYKRRATIVTKQ